VLNTEINPREQSHQSIMVPEVSGFFGLRCCFHDENHGTPLESPVRMSCGGDSVYFDSRFTSAHGWVAEEVGGWPGAKHYPILAYLLVLLKLDFCHMSLGRRSVCCCA